LILERGTLMIKCFACDKTIGVGGRVRAVSTRDGQTVYVGPECFRKVKNAEGDGYAPPQGGPRLFLTKYVD
jgi:hypothetical protein